MYLEAYVLCLGDFNLLLDPVMDRYGDLPASQPQTLSAFVTLVTEFGWSEWWLVSNTHTRAYSWFIPSRGLLSRIDLALGNNKFLTKLSSITYFSRGVPDHLPLLLSIDTGATGIYRPWWVQPFWLSLIGSNHRIPDKLTFFLKAHGTEQGLIIWDTLKAYLRGALKSTKSSTKLNILLDKMRKI